MLIIAYFLSLISLILNLSLLFRLRWHKGGNFLWLAHWAATALQPFLLLAGLMGAALGWVYHAPLPVVAGLIGTVISIIYIVSVTAPQPGFEIAFGPDWEQDIPAARAAHLLPRRWNIGWPRTGEPRWQRDVPFWTIPDSDRKLLCDLWQPPYGVPPSGLAFIYLHGSAWWFLDKDLGTRPFFRQLAGQGHVVMDVAYRLCPEVDIHGMVGDAKRAVAWMKAHAAEYGVDPGGVVLAGGSSGAHLALLAAYTPHNEHLNPPDLEGADLSVRAAVSYYGPSDMRGTYKYLGHDQGPRLPMMEIGLPGAATMKKTMVEVGRIDVLLGGHPDEVPEVYELASPVAHVQPGCPPTLLIQGELDAIAKVEATRELHRRLVECGVPAVNIIYPMTDHAFDLILPEVGPATGAALYYTERFLALMV